MFNLTFDLGGNLLININWLLQRLICHPYFEIYILLLSFELFHFMILFVQSLLVLSFQILNSARKHLGWLFIWLNLHWLRNRLFLLFLLQWWLWLFYLSSLLHWLSHHFLRLILRNLSNWFLHRLDWLNFGCSLILKSRLFRWLLLHL